jgi:hypothetical protein
MATRSTIAIELPSGKIKSVYCHWDGYLSYNGKILLEHYNDADKLLKLINKGSISSLGPEIGRKHPFSTYELNQDAPDYAKKLKAHADAQEKGWTKFYARDRGEKLVVDTYKDMGEYFRSQMEEYNYLFTKTGHWTVKYDEEGSWSLCKALEAYNEEA